MIILWLCLWEVPLSDAEVEVYLEGSSFKAEVLDEALSTPPL